MSRSIGVLLVLLTCAASTAAAEPFGGSGAHFFILQERLSLPSETSELCPRVAGMLTPGITSVREAQLVSGRPSGTTGELPEGVDGRTVGVLTACFGVSPKGSPLAYAFVELFEGVHELPVEAQGDCHTLETGDSELQLQACGLSVIPDPARGIRGGLLTSTGLIAADRPARAHNAHLWTLYLIRE